MTADPFPEGISLEEAYASVPPWLYPPPGGWTVDDLDRLPPEAPRRIELIDGALIIMSPQSEFHSAVIFGLRVELKRQKPKHLRVTSELTVRIPPNRPDPDLLIVSADAYRRKGPSRTAYEPSDVTLVVEVVSPESRFRDRERKPQIYARAGIPHYWRVENDDDRPMVYVFELDPDTGKYSPTGIFHGELKVSVPFPIVIDLDALTAEFYE